MDKPLREITVGEWKALCDKRTKELREEGRGAGECDGCLMSSVCAITPDEWNLPEDTTVTDAAKPRLAEVLGVEVEEVFTAETPFGDFKRCVVGENGEFFNAGTNVLAYIINHPESIIRAPRLTEAELAICKAVGAKWVSRDNGLSVAVLWMDKPRLTDSGYEGGTVAAEIYGKHFLCVRPGDCICVEEVGGDA